MNEPKNFTDGLFFNTPRENAPEWILGSLNISKARFLTWLDQQQEDDKGFVKIDIKKGKEDKIYCEKNNWKPQTR